MATARDKFWFFGVRPHQDDVYLGMNEKIGRNYPWSRITPTEGAHMLDVPNMILVNCDGVPAPFSAEAYGYAESFVRMNKVLWSATGSAGYRAGNEEAFICDLAQKYPNITGAFLDDPFHQLKDDPDAIEKASAILKDVRAGLDKACRPMDIYMVWYTHQMDSPEMKVLSLADGITLWTSDYRKLTELETHVERLEREFPNQKKMLGIYMYSFLEFLPVPDEYMQMQCEFGLRMLKEGRLDGMIFEANSVMGIGLPSEKWLRNWIDKVKDTQIPD